MRLVMPLRRTNLRRARAAASGGPSSSSLIQWPGDFTYLGSFRLPITIDADWLETKYSSGLAVVRRPADTTESVHLVSSSFQISPVNKGGMIYEYRIGTPTIPGGDPYDANNYPECTIVKRYGDVSSGKMLTTFEGNNVVFNGGVDARFGIGWDSANGRLYQTYGDTYRPADSTSPHFMYSTLDYDNETGAGFGPWQVSGQGYKSMLSGMLLAPADYATSHLGGNRVVLGWGGYGSITGTADVSMGVSLTAIPDPTGTAELGAVTGAVPLVGYWPYSQDPGAGKGRQNRSQNLILNDYPIDNWGADKYSWRDYPRGVVWIDTGTKRGILVISRESRGYVTYVNSGISGTTVGHAMSVYDPDDCTPVSGTPRYAVQPAQVVDFQFPTQNYANTNYAGGPTIAISSITSNSSKARNSNDGCLVTTATAHGFSGGQQIDVRGSNVSEHNGLWALPDAGPVDATSFYIRNAQAGGNWSGVSGSGSMTTRFLGGYADNEPSGMAFDETAKRLYLKCPAYAGIPTAFTYVHVYQLND